jgi:predicted phosphohydrolase
MARIVWLTDIHLNFATPPKMETFLAEVRAAEPTAVLVGGDIAESHDLLNYLERLDESIAAPVYFVLGNHDFYFGAIDTVRDMVERFCADRPKLHYLSRESPQELGPTVGLVGHDGWADGRLGNFERSMISMYDYKLIADLTGLTKNERWAVLKARADAAAAHLRKQLPAALIRYEQVFVLTHVPPFREACWHEGQISDDDWAPHFTSKAMGDAILEAADRYPQRRLTVLCGHTHGAGQCRPRPNVIVYTGGADYGNPRVERVFEVE